MKLAAEHGSGPRVSFTRPHEPPSGDDVGAPWTSLTSKAVRCGWCRRAGTSTAGARGRASSRTRRTRTRRRLTCSRRTRQGGPAGSMSMEHGVFMEHTWHICYGSRARPQKPELRGGRRQAAAAAAGADVRALGAHRARLRAESFQAPALQHRRPLRPGQCALHHSHPNQPGQLLRLVARRVFVHESVEPRRDVRSPKVRVRVPASRWACRATAFRRGVLQPGGPWTRAVLLTSILLLSL